MWHSSTAHGRTRLAHDGVAGDGLPRVQRRVPAALHAVVHAKLQARGCRVGHKEIALNQVQAHRQHLHGTEGGGGEWADAVGWVAPHKASRSDTAV
jgi:hypothetical protein